MMNTLETLRYIQQCCRGHDEWYLGEFSNELASAIAREESAHRPPIPCAAVFIRYGATYLIGERRHALTVEGQNEPCIPGGKVDWMESTVGAAIREIQEETLLELRPEEVTYLGYADELWENDGWHFVTHFFVADVDDISLLGEPEPHKIGGWQWLTKEEILTGQRMFASATDMAKLLPDTSDFIKDTVQEEAQHLSMGY